MVKVKMRQQHQANQLLLFQVQTPTDRARIDQYTVVEEKSTRSALERSTCPHHQRVGTMTAEHMDLHRQAS
jgi:hypothetical protein